MYIQRHIEPVVSRIAQRKPVVVLTGARQVGKSTMLEKIRTEAKYISLDRPNIRESAKENPSLFFDVNKPPVIVDEIQKAPSLFEYIKAIADEDKSKGQFFLTGSQSLKLMENVSESLAGRAGIIKMLGLSSREIEGVVYREPFKPTVTHLKAMQAETPSFDYPALITRIHRGSFPELYESEGTLDDWMDYYSSYFQTYIEKDIKDVLNIRDESAFIRFVRATAARTGQMLNYTSLADICGKSVDTVKAWISVLESCGLVYLLQPYHNNFNKRLVKTPKLYFLDTGLACWLTSWNTPQQMANGAMWGAIFESHVFSEILKSYFNQGIVVPPIYYYRDKDTNEIDLVIEEAGTLFPIEIKTTSDPQKKAVRSFSKLDSVPEKKRGEGAVVCLAKELLPLKENVWTVPANLI